MDIDPATQVVEQATPVLDAPELTSSAANPKKSKEPVGGHEGADESQAKKPKKSALETVRDDFYAAQNSALLGRPENDFQFECNHFDIAVGRVEAFENPGQRRIFELNDDGTIGVVKTPFQMHLAVQGSGEPLFPNQPIFLDLSKQFEAIKGLRANLATTAPPNSQLRDVFLIGPSSFDTSIIKHLLPIYTVVPSWLLHSTNAVKSEAAKGVVYDMIVQWTNKVTQAGQRLGLLIGPDRNYLDKQADQAALKARLAASKAK